MNMTCWRLRHAGAALLLLLLTGTATAQPPSAVGSALPRCPPALKIAFVDLEVSPFLHGSGDHFENPPGHFVQWAKVEAWRFNCKVEWLRLPPARLLVAMQRGEVDMAIGQAPTPEREKAWVYPRGAQGELNERLSLLASKHVLYARADRAAALGWDGKGFASGNPRVGVPRGSKQMTLAERKGWPVVPTMGTAQGLRMLRAERFELLLAPEVLVPAESLSEAPALVALQPALQETQYYAPVSPGLWKRNPDFVRAFWRGLCKASRQQSPGLPSCPA
jgi:ABC-type amino acid transport substrate-binding protein